MQKVKLWGIYLVAGVLTLVGVFTVPVFATSSSSPSYQIVEQEFGSSSSEEACSGSYCARTSLGDLAVGNAQAGESTAEFGPITPDEPSLEVIVDPGESNLGVLTTEKTSTKTMIVRVRSYLTNGYFMQITGDPPKYQQHTLHTDSTPTASQIGVEQFGINVRANTTPEVGADPVQVPSGEFSFGQVMPNYNQPNMFMYNSGDTVAYSDKESGRTDYTVSMIVNISSKTAAGKFNGDYSAVVVPQF